MKETLLKKSFKEQDVQRIRNIVTKKYGASTTVGIGYQKAQQFHKEGDVWEEDGKTWTIKNGIRTNISKLKQARDSVKIPLSCPKCGGAMNTQMNKKMYRIHGFCFDPCTVEYEASLREAGLYSQYEKRMIGGNIKEFIKDVEDWYLDILTESANFVTENGEIEEWNNNATETTEKTMSAVREYVNILKNQLGNQ